MTLLTMTIPDDEADLPRWLERRLMAPDFGLFFAELSAHFPANSGTSPPRPLLERWTPVALERGLAEIPADLLRQLLQHPAALAAFQERIVADGGAYWDDVLDRSGDLTGLFDRGKESLEKILTASTPMPNGRALPNHGRETVPSEMARRTGGRRYKIWAIASTGIAACLAVAIGVLMLSGPGESPVPKSQIAWGWGKPSGLALDQSDPKAYLNKLAANAEEWSQYQPNDAVGVATRIAELRVGCTRLMNSNYGMLKPADKAWMLEQCQAWAKMLDGHQQALDSGANPLTVRAEVDETVRTIAATLRERAKQIG